MTFKLDQNHENEKKVDYNKMDGSCSDGNGGEEVIENRIYVGGGNEFEYLSNEYLMKDL